MTRCSIFEYGETVQERYLRSKKTVKTKILDEFVAATRLHRKAAVRLLNRVGKKGGKKKSGRPKLYVLKPTRRSRWPGKHPTGCVPSDSGAFFLNWLAS